MDKKEQQNVDPVQRQETVSSMDRGDGLSAMSPPEAYDPPAKCVIAYEDMNPFLQQLHDEHEELNVELKLFKEVLTVIQRGGGFTKDTLSAINRFFTFFDKEFVAHNKKEERYLFPILDKRLLESGEHSPTKNPITGITVLESEHIQALQIATLSMNYFDLVERVYDENSKHVILQMALNKGFELIELMDLHIFRENEVVFGLAHELLTEEELAELTKLMKQ